MTWIDHKIEIEPCKPIVSKFYPYSQKVEEDMHNQLDEMLALGIVEPSTSPWHSPIVMQKKHDGTYRFCVDFQRINLLTLADIYPLPNMDNVLRKLRKARFILTIDIRTAFDQIPLTQESKQYTAFSIPGRGSFQFTRLPYGLKQSSATFQRLADEIVGSDCEFAYTYIDDIIIASVDFKSHLKHIEYVLKRIYEARLTVDLDKRTSVKNKRVIWRVGQS